MQREITSEKYSAIGGVPGGSVAKKILRWSWNKVWNSEHFLTARVGCFEVILLLILWQLHVLTTLWISTFGLDATLFDATAEKRVNGIGQVRTMTNREICGP